MDRPALRSWQRIQENEQWVLEEMELGLKRRSRNRFEVKGEGVRMEELNKEKCKGKMKGVRDALQRTGRLGDAQK